ncbi:MAG: type II secretion system protein [Betaproteobacteria bacterium]|nr:type II secretion system protein [Betaproteobacteria bacterium]
MSIRRAAGERGLSLVEQIVFIVVVAVAVAGVLAALNLATRASADPMIQKQALAVAEALLEEVQLQPFTYCDPDDAQAATAESATVGAAGCAATVEAIGPEGETRTVSPLYDNVNDYQATAGGLVLTGISDINGTAIPGLENYTATITVAAQALDTVAALDADMRPQSLLISVRVTGPGNVDVLLHGYRTRYAPNALP